MKGGTVVFLFLTIIKLSLGSRILFIFPTPSKSHMIIIHALSTALAERGHDVTVVSPFPLNESIKNHREILLPISDGTQRIMNEIIKSNPKLSNFLISMSNMNQLVIELSKDVKSSEAFQKVMNEKFDLVVVGMIMQNYLLGLGEHFNCPTIMFSVQRHMSFTNLLVGNPLAPNSAAHHYIEKFNMNFIDRVKNFLLLGADLLLNDYLNYQQRKIYREFFPSTKYRSYDEAMRNISLVLVNDHFTQGVVRPNVPAVIEIRGIHIKPAKKLPDDLQKFIDEASDGVIFFSLGTNIKPEFVSQDSLKIILSTFSKLSQRVIMKWDNEEIDEISENVLVRNWLPQSDILAHQNVKLFISHCGLGGIAESQFRGVPILGLPMFGDQLMNAKLAVEEGWAIEMDLKNLNETYFYEIIQELINNETYSTKVKSLSRLYHDRPLSPRDTAIYWTEYVINHKGAKHMQDPAVHQNFWQRNSLDVIAFILLCLFVIVKLLKFSFKNVVLKIAKKIFSKKENVNKNKKVL